MRFGGQAKFLSIRQHSHSYCPVASWAERSSLGCEGRIRAGRATVWPSQAGSWCPSSQSWPAPTPQSSVLTISRLSLSHSPAARTRLAADTGHAAVGWAWEPALVAPCPGSVPCSAQAGCLSLRVYWPLQPATVGKYQHYYHHHGESGEMCNGNPEYNSIVVMNFETLYIVNLFWRRGRGMKICGYENYDLHIN